MTPNSSPSMGARAADSRPRSMSFSRSWETWFLEERPSVSLSLFRLALAATIGLHIFPTFLQMGDNYLSTGFREYNPAFFPVESLMWVSKNPDGAVKTMAAVFTLSWLAFLLGLWTRKSGIVMALGCYYFYARNSLHIGTLSYDILLVTLFLCLVTPYLGDSFSLDSVLSGDAEAFRRKRPIFLQRLLQLQIAQTFFYTGLCKWTAQGNWLTDNPYWYLMNNPPTGVIKQFPFRSFLAGHPDLCYLIGVTVICLEMSLWFWLFWRKTRPYAIACGIVFHFLLLFTMHVPTIFFFLFPPQLLLFIDPETVVEWIEGRRALWELRGRHRLIYDGDCCFCRGWMARVQAADPTGRVEAVDLRRQDVKTIDPRLTQEACEARIHLIERGGRISSGFAAFRRLSLLLPLLWPAAPFFHIPGIQRIGDPVYDWVARIRFELSSPHR